MQINIHVLYIYIYTHTHIYTYVHLFIQCYMCIIFHFELYIYALHWIMCVYIVLVTFYIVLSVCLLIYHVASFFIFFKWIRFPCIDRHGAVQCSVYNRVKPMINLAPVGGYYWVYLYLGWLNMTPKGLVTAMVLCWVDHITRIFTYGPI